MVVPVDNNAQLDYGLKIDYRCVTFVLFRAKLRNLGGKGASGFFGKGKASPVTIDHTVEGMV